MQNMRDHLSGNTSVYECEYKIATLDGDRETIRYLGYIEELAFNAARQITELTQWMRYTVSNKVSFSVVHFKEIIDKLIEEMRTKSDQKHLFIQNTVSSEMPLCINREIITLILRNFLSNSIKYLVPNGEIDIVTTHINNKYKISVIDNGIGMNSRKLENIFKVPTQLSPGTYNEIGHGIGLKICFDLAQKVHAHLSAKSVEGKGSTFSIEFE